MLIKNLKTNIEHWGHYTLHPGQWAYLPSQIAIQAGLSTNPGFQCLPDFLAGEQADVVIFSGCPIDTTGGGQHPAQIAKALRAKGHRVLYVQSAPSSLEDPYLMVLRDNKLAQEEEPTDSMLQMWIETLVEFSKKPDRIALFTFPSRYLLGLAQAAWTNGYKTVYWCLDDWQEINLAQNREAYNEDVEAELVRFCDKTLVTAGVLGAKLAEWTDKPIDVIPNGFSRENFPVCLELPEKPADLRLGEKTLVYWGELQGRWLDVDLIEGLARLEPGWTINLIGPYQRSERRINLPNVHYLGEKLVSELYRYGYHADCGLIPFKAGRLTDAVNPIKAYEYLACNLPVVSIPMPELDAFPFAFQVPGEAEAFRDAIRNLPDKSEWQAEINDFLARSTWGKRVECFLSVVKACSDDLFRRNRPCR